MQHEVKQHLLDIREAIKEIDLFIGEDKRFDAFDKNRLVVRAVERCFEIIGEAMNRIKRDAPTLVLNNMKAIINVRNRVIHAYDAVDNAIIWGIIINHLPKLKTEVEQLIKNYEN